MADQYAHVVCGSFDWWEDVENDIAMKTKAVAPIPITAPKLENEYACLRVRQQFDWWEDVEDDITKKTEALAVDTKIRSTDTENPASACTRPATSRKPAPADLLKPCSFNWADDAEEEFDNLNSITQPNNHCTTVHPLTRALAQAIAEANGDEAMEIFSYQKTAVFKPSLSAIEEECANSRTCSAYSLEESIGRTEISERVLHVHYTAHPNTLAIAQAISEFDEEGIMTTFRCQRIPLFQPSLPSIEEEGCHTPSQPSPDRSSVDVLGKADNSEIVFRSSQRLRRTTNTRDLRGYTTRKSTVIPLAQYNLPTTKLSTPKASSPSSLIAPDYEFSYGYTEFPRLPRQRKRDVLKRIVKQVFRKLHNLQATN
ncbi:Major facilitator superfamily domain general substrate transporter [Penicillium verrucosum]|uniref:Major facilitator superfamily domain general substrate transporter n=1 Tax=Penicillium verrucosum TaxID=60171 RepID=UPI0025450DD6|nr:Major facilitator superfamily domain general substrate transporter [Penicillium verrucosum]KAJ5932199.1 Major facilitator superfamily domain general substrate transporter [Penicillium verrucosum]